MKDNGFCSPVVDEVELAAKKKKKEMDHEIELIKKEYEEKMKKKKSKDQKDKEADGKDKEKEEAYSEYKKAEKEKDDKVCSRHCCHRWPCPQRGVYRSKLYQTNSHQQALMIYHAYMHFTSMHHWLNHVK